MDCYSGAKISQLFLDLQKKLGKISSVLITYDTMILSTTIPLWKQRFSSYHRSQATQGMVSTGWVRGPR